MDELVFVVNITISTNLVARSDSNAEGSSDRTWIVEVKTWMALELVEREVPEFKYILHHVRQPRYTCLPLPGPIPMPPPPSINRHQPLAQLP